MHRLRPALALAILAALVLAPSSAFAASPNQLHDAQVDPPGGDAGSSFSLSVRYTSSAGHAATGVTASVGALSVPLSLVSGTSLDGTWAGSTVLPAGDWRVTFHATTTTGNSPQLDAAMLLVSPSLPGIPATQSPDADIEPGAGTATAAPAPQDTPLPAKRPADGAPRRSPAPSSTRPDPDVRAPGRANGDGDGNHDPGRRPRGARGTASPDGAVASPLATLPTSTSPEDGVPGPDTLSGVLALGMAGLAAVALGGSIWLLMASRRRRAAESAGRSGTSGDPAIDAIPSVDRRAIRRARLRATQDPILAGMGLDAEDDVASPRARSGKAAPRPRRGHGPPRKKER